jgi:hypothetical protein
MKMGKTLIDIMRTRLGGSTVKKLTSNKRGPNAPC